MTHSIDFSDEDYHFITAVKFAIKSKLSCLSKVSCYHDMFLSGGAIASLIQSEEPKDWDVYFKTQSSQDKVIEEFKTNFIDDVAVIDEKYREVGVDGLVITENAMTLKNGIQLITKHNGSPDEVRATFDFVHCKPYYDIFTDQLFISKEQYDLCKNKKLKINNEKQITSWRQVKFDQRGYTWLIP